MPKSWSNRPIEHIDLEAARRGVPPAAMIVIGFGILAFCAVTILAVRLMLHPIQTPVDESSPTQQHQAAGSTR